MKTLVLADIHANAAAFRAVMDDVGTFDRLVFLGDLANFGPHPSQCVQLMQEYPAVLIMGNHDAHIISETPAHRWDQWAKAQLSGEQQQWMRRFQESTVLDEHILLIHSASNTTEDLYPTSTDEEIRRAFAGVVTDGIDEVWFGHYHYHIERRINGVTYRCIRPVGQHRDRDTRTSYSIYENGQFTTKRIPYNLRETAEAVRELPVFKDETQRDQFMDFLENAFHAELLRKDIQMMGIQNG